MESFPAAHRPDTHRTERASTRPIKNRIRAGVFALSAVLAIILVSITTPGAATGQTATRVTSTKAASTPDLRAAPVLVRPAATPAPSLQLGLQLFSMWRDWDTHVALMDQVVASGTKWLRVDVGWCSLEEHGAGVISAWYQQRLDTTVHDARARGLKLLLTLTCTPTWATADGTTNGYPTQPAQFQRIAQYLSNRYRGQVAAWEIWNEPDCITGCGQSDLQAYVPILRAGFTGVRAGDPAATVLNGGLSGIDTKSIGLLLAAGAGRYFDALAVHPYLAPAAAPPDTPATAGYSNPYRITNLPAARALLVKYGYAAKKIWLTEFGWSTGRTPGSPYDGVTPSVQASYLTAAVQLLTSRYPYVTNAFWYTTRDRDDSNAYENGFGILTTSGQRKPAFAALTRANTQLQGTAKPVLHR